MLSLKEAQFGFRQFLDVKIFSLLDCGLALHCCTLLRKPERFFNAIVTSVGGFFH